MSADEGHAYDRGRSAMVERQLRERGIRDPRVLEAMALVPREAFVPEWRRDAAYADAALPIPGGQTISQPYVVARMTELLDVVPGIHVLEVGTGSGYQAAVLAELGAVVTSIERVAELGASARERLRRLGYGERVTVTVGDGSLGDPEHAPWARIIATAAAPRVPVPLREQLDPAGGRLVIPVGGRDHQELLVIERHGDEWIERSDGAVVFVPLLGEAGWDGGGVTPDGDAHGASDGRGATPDGGAHGTSDGGAHGATTD